MIFSVDADFLYEHKYKRIKRESVDDDANKKSDMDDYNIKCSKCVKTFNRKHLYVEHQKLHHLGKLNFYIPSHIKYTLI